MGGARVSGLNRLTLAVSDLERSVAFYREVLGCTPRAIWSDGAYMEAGTVWLCLSKDAEVRTAPHPDYSHIAFDVEAASFDALCAAVVAEAPVWKQNTSEGLSLYFWIRMVTSSSFTLARSRRVWIIIELTRHRASGSSERYF